MRNDLCWVEAPEKIAIGSFTIAFLTDGLWWNDGGCMLGVVPRELWKREHPPDEQNRIRLNLTCPLIIRGRDAILVDTGIGNRLADVERKIFSTMAKDGCPNICARWGWSPATSPTSSCRICISITAAG